MTVMLEMEQELQQLEKGKQPKGRWLFALK